MCSFLLFCWLVDFNILFVCSSLGQENEKKVQNFLIVCCVFDIFVFFFCMFEISVHISGRTHDGNVVFLFGDPSKAVKNDELKVLDGGHEKAVTEDNRKRSQEP